MTIEELFPLWYRFLIEEKLKDLANCGDGTMTDDVIRLREEITEQRKALEA